MKEKIISIIMIILCPIAIPFTLAFAIAENQVTKSNEGFKIGIEMWKEIFTFKFE